MNPRINEYFDEIEAQLVASAVVASFDVIRREVTSTEGKIRLRAQLTNGALLELFEYCVERERQIHLRKYRLHWQDASGRLVQRWDNAKHHPDLPNAPHHTHDADGSVSPVVVPPDALEMLEQVERRIAEIAELC
jgi:hypothetical protein